MRKEMKSVSNLIVNERYDRKLRLIDLGYNIGSSVEDIENERKLYLK